MMKYLTIKVVPIGQVSIGINPSLHSMLENMWLDHYADHSFCSGTTIMGF